MTHAYSVSTKGRALALALAVGLSVSGIVALAGGAASAPSAAQEQCPTPEGGGTQSPTATACPTPTGSPGQTGTPTSTGTSTTTATSTTTSSPGTQPPGTSTVTSTTTVTSSPASPGPGSRAITLEASRERKTYGKEFVLSGGISSPSPQCVTAEVEIFRTVVGSSTQELFATLSTNADGTFSDSFTADLSANYIAHVDPSGTCGEANSDPVPVLVRVAVNLNVSKQRVAPGSRVRLRSSVLPCGTHEGTRVILFRLIAGDFAKVDSTRLNDECRARFTKRVRKSTAFQVRWPKQDADHLSGRSRKKAVQVRRR